MIAVSYLAKTHLKQLIIKRELTWIQDLTPNAALNLRADKPASTACPECCANRCKSYREATAARVVIKLTEQIKDATLSRRL